MNKICVLLLALVSIYCSNNNNSKKVIQTGVPVEHIDPTKDQQTRRAASEAYCKAHDIPVYSNPNALFVDAEKEVTIRTEDEVENRALALCYIGLKGEGLDQKQLDKINKDLNITPKLSPKEIAFARSKQPTEQEMVDASWRYESLHVMLWALGFIDSLSYPDKMCDVENDVRIIHDLSEKEFKEKAKLRSKKEILDQADLALRLDWACVNSRVNKETVPGNLDKGVVYERHYSLNWLIHYMNLDWDDVTTDT